MIVVAVGLIIDNGKVLLCQRKKTARYALKWEFPGGKKEHGETIEDCLRRELREELEIDAEIGALYHRQGYNYSDSGSFDVHYYIVPSYRGEMKNHVFESIEWIPLSSLLSYDILEGNTDVARKLTFYIRETEPREK
ncbi:MAG TPA: NUDIX domain-containing protein [Bacteroidota bacterium]|nr:NUDIX domain-containing protein [Bacteroidota bacterium]